MFDATKEKVEWAERQISDLEAGFGAFLNAGHCTWDSTPDPADGNLAIEASCLEPIPLELTLMLGEVINNLRAALDHATGELIGIDANTQDVKIIFPVTTKQEDFVTRIRQIKTRRDDTRAFLMSLEAYQGGTGKLLYALEQLDITSKHAVLTPIIGVAKIGPVKLLNTNGTPASTPASLECSMGTDGRARLRNVSSGTTVEIDENATPAFDVFFGDVEQFRFQRIIPTLRILAGAVKETVRRFDRFVTTRV